MTSGHHNLALRHLQRAVLLRPGFLFFEKIGFGRISFYFVFFLDFSPLTASTTLVFVPFFWLFPLFLKCSPWLPYDSSLFFWLFPFFFIWLSPLTSHHDVLVDGTMVFLTWALPLSLFPLPPPLFFVRAGRHFLLTLFSLSRFLLLLFQFFCYYLRKALCRCCSCDKVSLFFFVVPCRG